MSDATKEMLEGRRKVADITAGLYRDADHWTEVAEFKNATQTVALIDFALAAHDALEKSEHAIDSFGDYTEEENIAAVKAAYIANREALALWDQMADARKETS